MKIRPDLTVDGGTWISDDRVYAFVGAGGIGEVGYHGSQPVSRNSRIFAGVEGVLAFGPAGSRVREFDWLPGSVRILRGVDGGESEVRITASGRRLIVTGGCSGPFTVTFRLDALFTAVHGKRTWEVVERDGNSVTYRCRDTIHLDEWMEREGPYAGDFLIPEPMRRIIFRRRCRSGFATKEDLLPEYRGAHVPVYDGELRVRIGGEGYEVTEEAGALRFTSSASRDGIVPPFCVSFDEAGAQPEGRPEILTGVAEVVAREERRLATVPALQMEGHEHVKRFFVTVPGLVDSAVVRDLGTPRATPGRYYWIWSWDAMVTAHAGLLWGDTDLARKTGEFVDAHRDADGRMPMQWTRDMQPLDAQEPGSLDVLLYTLVYSAYLEHRDISDLEWIYPRMREFLGLVLARSDQRGLFPNIGFYPDLPLRFHRTITSAVAMEVAGFYTFCRICENVARLFSDDPTASRAAAAATTLETTFDETFYDSGKDFWIDSVDLENGERNTSFPVFTLLFLHSPLGLSLIRGRLKDAGEFISRHLCARFGLRLLPEWDRNAATETVSGSWYPHWDVYALTVLRRAGRSAEIVRWLSSMNDVLGWLGYAPEFLMLEGLPEEKGRHGAASNLNCATGWYRALLVGLCGLEIDPGGITVLPLDLPLGRVALSGIRSHGTRWDLAVEHGGPYLRSFSVDGEEIRGCLKIPARYHDGGRHLIELRYGEERLAAPFAELTNAEVLDVRHGPSGTQVAFRALGRVEVVLAGDHTGDLRLDGEVFAAGPLAGGSVFSLDLVGEHRLMV